MSFVTKMLLLSLRAPLSAGKIGAAGAHLAQLSLFAKIVKILFVCFFGGWGQFCSHLLQVPSRTVGKRPVSLAFMLAIVAVTPSGLLPSPSSRCFTAASSSRFISTEALVKHIFSLPPSAHHPDGVWIPPSDYLSAASCGSSTEKVCAQTNLTDDPVKWNRLIMEPPNPA